ncbi:MAG TPA: hypothetical protein VFB96_01155 [Pirellulaceae bacterium]|nr:hypothetical protein [Pirellulaceae bacterium]
MSLRVDRFHPSIRRRRLVHETLERRSVLAGNVAATFTDGSLSVFGDDQSNVVEIVAVGGDVLVRGLDNTSINGQPQVVFTAGSLGLVDLSVVLGSGPDELLLHDLAIAGNVALGRGQVDTIFDAGNDQIFLDHVAIGGDLRLNSGGGADLVVLTDVAVAGEAALRTGSGNDRLEIVDSALNDLTILTASGRDQVFIDSSVIADLTVRLGIGDDTLSILGDSVVGRVDLNGGSGLDRLRRDVDAAILGFPLILSFERRVIIV